MSLEWVLVNLIYSFLHLLISVALTIFTGNICMYCIFHHNKPFIFICNCVCFLHRVSLLVTYVVQMGSICMHIDATIGVWICVCSCGVWKSGSLQVKSAQVDSTTIMHTHMYVYVTIYICMYLNMCSINMFDFSKFNCCIIASIEKCDKYI